MNLNQPPVPPEISHRTNNYVVGSILLLFSSPRDAFFENPSGNCLIFI